MIGQYKLFTSDVTNAVLHLQSPQFVLGMHGGVFLTLPPDDGDLSFFAEIPQLSQVVSCCWGGLTLNTTVATSAG